MLYFGAGPGRIPGEVAQAVANHIVPAQGLSALEIGDRSLRGQTLLSEIQELASELLEVPSSFRVLLVPGGGTHQFVMAGYSLQQLVTGISFVETDYWTTRARQEMANFVPTASIFDGSAGAYRELPADLPSAAFPDGALFLTSNNTAAGTQWPKQTAWDRQPALCISDMSSDLFGRQPDYDQMSLVLACAQKNFGVAGLSLAIIRSDLLAEMRAPGALCYASWAGAKPHSTFPVLPAVVTLECLRYMRFTGLDVIRRRVTACSTMLYKFLDSSEVFCPFISPEARSCHNVTFDVRRGTVEDVLSAAAGRGIDGIKGHPSVGGLRASFYFGADERDAAALTSFLRDYEHAVLR